MNNQRLVNLLEEYGTYSHLQEKVARAIQDNDEQTVTALELEARELLNRLKPGLELLVNSAANCKSGSQISPEGLHSLIQCIKESQSQILTNQKALMNWKNELGISVHNSSAQVGAGKPTWESRSRQTHIGRELDRLT